tara:strand:+ start:662 stop:1174 length:513 start_codon:yes stop_codon:yes gene_type:complete
MSIISKNKSNEYYTPKSAWEDIIPYLPKDKVYLEPFNNINEPTSLLSKQYLQELGLNILDTPPYNDKTGENDFFNNDGKDWDICIGNPPFSIKQDIVKKLKELNKPFILILPTSTMNTGYFKNLFGDKLQIVIPKKRINFNYYKDDKKSCCFDCIYFCYNINLEKDLIFL